MIAAIAFVAIFILPLAYMFAPSVGDAFGQRARPRPFIQYVLALYLIWFVFVFPILVLARIY